MKQRNGLLAVICGLFIGSPAHGDLAPCEQLVQTTTATRTVVSTELVAATPQLPRHCRAEGTVNGTIRFELRLPDKWNGKFLMVGNGGYLGAFFDQSYGLARGYATASTDTGHRGPSPEFALNNPESEKDFAYRAVHLTAKSAKQLIDHYYGEPPDFSYFRGCSTGGRQGLVEAQRYPDDFDGFSIGAPIYDYTEKQIYSASWVAQAMFSENRKGYVPRRKLPALGAAVYEQCDAIDGLTDGIIDDPRQCTFNPSDNLPRCPNDHDANDCFTDDQIAAITRIYDGPGAGRYPGAVFGAEWLETEENAMSGGWDTYITGALNPTGSLANTVGQMNRDPYGGNEFQPVQLRNAISFFKFFAFQPDRPDYDVLTDLNFDQVPDTSAIAHIMNATSTDLARVAESGKKIILWHGWADVGLNPLRTIQYFEAVQAAHGKGPTDNFLRLFMVPGMYHCEGGPGPDVFDDLTALENWVELGHAPRKLIAYKTKGPNDYYPDRAPPKAVGTRDRTLQQSRPLCQFPRVARHCGEGSTDNAANFTCALP